QAPPADHRDIPPLHAQPRLHTLRATAIRPWRYAVLAFSRPARRCPVRLTALARRLLNSYSVDHRYFPRARVARRLLQTEGAHRPSTPNSLKHSRGVARRRLFAARPARRER